MRGRKAGPGGDAPRLAPLQGRGGLHIGISGLYHPRFEHDSCGVGFVASTAGRSHAILERALEAAANLTHRGAVSADGKTGDGAGVLTQIPHRLLAGDLQRLEVRVQRHSDLGVGMIFLPQDAGGQAGARAIIEEAVIKEGAVLFGWRKVPVAASALGAEAGRTRPQIEQVLLGRPERMRAAEFERALYLARNVIERRWEAERIGDAYIPSLSHHSVVYKGMFIAPQLPRFYPDLVDPRFETALAVFHQRYSTNTFPSWRLAQPFRLLAHNGEINTLWGNLNWMRAREADLRSPLWRERMADLLPVIRPGGSDSAALDNVLELVVHSGRDLLHAMMMLVPEAWENVAEMPEDLRAFYEFHAGLAEPWDGPAALAFSDGRVAAAALDRNGLRPARYTIADDGLVIVASEAGIVPLDPARIVEKGRLGPGRMIAVDTAAGRIRTNETIKRERARTRPYAAGPARTCSTKAPSTPASLSSGARSCRILSSRTSVCCRGFGRAPCPWSSRRPRAAKGLSGGSSACVTKPSITSRKGRYSSCSPTAPSIRGRRPSRCSWPWGRCTRNSSAGACGCG